MRDRIRVPQHDPPLAVLAPQQMRGAVGEVDGLRAVVEVCAVVLNVDEARPVLADPAGHVLEELLELFVTAGFDPQEDQIDNPDDLLRLGLHRLPLTQFPRLRSLAAVLATFDGATELDEGLSIVLAGLRSQLRT